MEAIIEKSANGRTIHIYEVEIEYQIANAHAMAEYELQRRNGIAAEPPAVASGAYVRLFDVPDVHDACHQAFRKFEGFVQGQNAVIKSQVIRRCDLKFRGHAF